MCDGAGQHAVDGGRDVEPEQQSGLHHTGAGDLQLQSAADSDFLDHLDAAEHIGADHHAIGSERGAPDHKARHGRRALLPSPHARTRPHPCLRHPPPRRIRCLGLRPFARSLRCSRSPRCLPRRWDRFRCPPFPRPARLPDRALFRPPPEARCRSPHRPPHGHLPAPLPGARPAPRRGHRFRRSRQTRPQTFRHWLRQRHSPPGGSRSRRLAHPRNRALLSRMAAGSLGTPLPPPPSPAPLSRSPKNTPAPAAPRTSVPNPSSPCSNLPPASPSSISAPPPATKPPKPSNPAFAPPPAISTCIASPNSRTSPPTSWSDRKSTRLNSSHLGI